MKRPKEEKIISMRMDPELWRRVKAKAAIEGINITDLVSIALKEKLSEGK